jgi:hypothetical protein
MRKPLMTSLGLASGDDGACSTKPNRLKNACPNSFAMFPYLHAG